MSLFGIFDDGQERPPAPEVATADDVERYNMEWAQKNPRSLVDDGGPNTDATADMPFSKELADDSVQRKAEFPWLYEPDKGVRWDFDPIKLRNLAQENTWVGMLIQTITKEVAETPWTVVKSDADRQETRKRLDTHPDNRSPIAKADGAELADDTAEDIYELLWEPNPEHGWHDFVEMQLSDLLEVGSATAVKYFSRSVYDDPESDNPELLRDADEIKPRAIMGSAPEVWTKDYHGRTGVLDGYWQFDHERSAGSGSASGGTSGTYGFRTPISYDLAEVMWTDESPRNNRRYGLPPTLLVEDFLKSLDLAVNQEQQYLSRGSIPSGAWIFEQYDREELRELKEEQLENVKGKPHKSLVFAGKGGDVSFEPMSMNFKELEFTERMQYYSRVVASIFQVPTAVVGIEPEKVNYNTFQGERENFEENTLGPYLQKLERYINDQLIRPHWGYGYHFEFKPGVSESTRQRVSERVRAEWNANLIKRSTALEEMGKELPDDADDGYKADVVDEDDGENPLAGLQMSVEKADADAVEKDDGGEFAADVFRLIAPNDAEYVTEEVVGIGVDFPNDAVYVDWRNEVFADELENSHVSIYGSIDDLTQATDNTVEPIDTLDAVAGRELARSVVKSAVENDTVEKGDPTRENHQVDPGEGVGTCENTGETFECETMADLAGDCPHCGDPISYIDEDDLDKSDGGSGNAEVRKDEPLRETDEWYQFDVQPGMVDELQGDIAEEIDALYESVLSDDEIQRIIERLAADDGETEKSVTSLARELKDLLKQSRLAGDVAEAIRNRTADAVGETLERTIEEVDEAPADAIDVREVTSKLRDRDIGFANDFADQISEDIRETVGDGWAEGKNSREIASDISEQSGLKEGWGGAERIARQELQIATGEARSEVAGQLDKVEVWQTSGDRRVRDAHGEMDGLWKRPGEEWEVDYSDRGRGVQKESVPGDSEPGIGCRCFTVLRDVDEVDDADHAGA